MQIRKIDIINIFLILLVGIYVVFGEISVESNIRNAVITLFFSLMLLHKARNNIPIFLLVLFVVYSNYSIIIGDYIVGGHLGIPIHEVKTVEIYGLLIKIMLLFTSIVALFFRPKTLSTKDFRIQPANNLVVFWGLFVILCYVLITGVERGAMTVYSVRISPLYEYSTLLFLCMYYFSGNSKFRKSIMIALILMFIFQDFYYGGRITSIQLLILLALTVFAKYLTVKNIGIGTITGIFLVSVVGAFRKTYSLQSIDLSLIYNKLTENYFVFDTPVYAYYASATHIAASAIVDFNTKITSFSTFLVSIFTGEFSEISNVTNFVRNNYFNNIGGGVIPSHFYFWLGWAGVILIAIIIVMFLNSSYKVVDSNFRKVVLIVFVLTVPRWYLYSPLLLFRPLVLTGCVFLLLLIIHKITKKKHAHIKVYGS